MQKIHFILQGKGGVGKSLISSLLMQYQIKNGIETIAIDTDPVNASFSAYKDFNAIRIELLNLDRVLQPKKFDDLIEIIINNNDKDIIIDNGASSFIPLATYINDNAIVDMLNSMNKLVIFHTVITGGQASLDTVNGFNSLAEQFDVPIIIWLNNYFGEFFYENKSFEETKAYQLNKNKVCAIVNIEKQSNLFEDDFKKMIERHLTFEQVKNSEDFSFMEKNRLSILESKIFFQLDNLRDALNILSNDHD